MKTVAIVVPCHNEAARLDTEAFRAAVDWWPQLKFVFVDDGSSDTTAAVLRGLVSGSDALRAVYLPKNIGKAGAVRAGVNAALEDADTDLVGFWDADLATPLAEIPVFRGVFESDPAARAVIGSRDPSRGTKMERSAFRRFTGSVMKRLIRAVLRTDVYDTQCGAKLFDRALAKEIFADPFRTKWLFDVELLKRIGEDRLGAGLRELPLGSWHDVPGSNLGLKDTFRIYRELLTIAFARNAGGKRT